jgi:hypothetical protein
MRQVIEYSTVVIEPNGYNKKAQKRMRKAKELAEKKRLPRLVADKNTLERKLLLEKHRGMYIYTTDESMLGIINEAELKKFYVAVDNSCLLNKMLNDYKEKVEGFCDDVLSD